MNKCPICGKEIPNYSVGDFFPWQCMGHHNTQPYICPPYTLPQTYPVESEIQELKDRIKKLEKKLK